MLLPKKLKHRKHHRGQMPGFDRRGSTLAYGTWGLKSLERGWVNSREIEAARRAITRFMKRGGQVWIRIFPDKPVTKASPETPMGSGKGALDHFVAVVRPGRILFEIGGVDELTAREAMRLGMHKLSVKTRLIRKGDQ